MIGQLVWFTDDGALHLGAGGYCVAVAAQSKPCLQMLPAVPGMTEARAAAVDTSWGLSWWSALHPHKGGLYPPGTDPAHGMDLVFAQEGVTSETRGVE